MESKDGLNTIRTSFEPVDTEAWIEKILHDLRGKSLEDVTWKYDRDISISPFADGPKDGHEGTEIGFNANWEIAEEFHVSNDAKVNEEILTALRGGCETLIIKISDIPDWSVLFSEVSLDMIRTYVVPPPELQEACVDSLNSWLAKSDTPSNKILVRSDKVATMGAAHEASEQSVVDLLVKTIRAGTDLIEATHVNDKIECIAEIGPHFFVEVARLRALRIVWKNVLEALAVQGPDLLLEVRMAEKFMADDRHSNMISAGAKTIAAICGNADRIVINPASVHDDALSRRIARNVHHVLKYESNLNGIPDPVKGSFYLEKLTEQMVRATWEKLTED